MTTLNGQTIGMAHYATRALLERELTRVGVTFHQSVALNAIAQNDADTDIDQLLARMTSTLKIDEPTATAAITGLVDTGLLTRSAGASLRLTESGRQRQQQLGLAVQDITRRLYADLPADDLAIAGRVVAAVTDRADAELSSPS
ncbi:MAG: MarR family winged helix-turn-helix transcriptional regulator [Micromonosporaceae bacterium]